MPLFSHEYDEIIIKFGFQRYEDGRIGNVVDWNNWAKARGWIAMICNPPAKAGGNSAKAGGNSAKAGGNSRGKPIIYLHIMCMAIMSCLHL